jgi:hypothetical protein
MIAEAEIWFETLRISGKSRSSDEDLMSMNEQILGKFVFLSEVVQQMNSAFRGVSDAEEACMFQFIIEELLDPHRVNNVPVCLP